MQIKRLAALSLAAVFTAATLTGCPWDIEDDASSVTSSPSSSTSRPSYDDDDDSGSAPSSSTPDENNKLSVENGKLTVQAGVTELTAEDITSEMKAAITEVTLNSVKVGPGTFKGCNNLTTVTITGGSLNTDSDPINGPFYNCDGLTTVNLSNVTINGFGTFAGCTKLREVDLTGVTMGNDAGSTFFLCEALTKVIGANTLKTIPESMFANCFSLQNIDVSGATSIGENAFGGCNSLEHIRVGTGLTSIGNHAFIAYVNSGDGIVVSPMKLTVHCIGQKDQNSDLETKFSSSGSYADGYPQFTYNCDSDCWNKIVNENQPDGSDAGDALARHFGLTLPL